jgi:sporadic carbohydrate cluster 2OG-Fe(II) oxygenase/sporadic carbohydrate cluster protein (TIGR04323 family)
MFDASVHNYDKLSYLLSDKVLYSIQKYYPEIKDLSLLHQHVPSKKIGELVKVIGKDLFDTDFYVYFDKLVSEYILPKFDCDILIQKFGNVRVTIPNQDRNGTVLPFHQGKWVGNGLGLRTIWLPFTDAYDSNSIQIIDIETSREITKKSISENWSYEKFQDVCQNICHPINIKEGQYLLFTQENIHGGIPNKTGKTRMSIDVRILLRDGQPHRKWPGAYFRILGDTDIQPRKIKILNNENVIMYAEYEGFKTKHIDLHFQTLTVKEYCNRMGYIFPYQTGDNEGRNHAYLEYLIEHGNVNHILMFSIFSLPDNFERRNYLMNLALKNKCNLHFANEELVLNSQNVLDKIEYLRNFTSDWSNPVHEN